MSLVSYWISFNLRLHILELKRLLKHIEIYEKGRHLACQFVFLLRCILTYNPPFGRCYFS
jgi:hypothetical protein